MSKIRVTAINSGTLAEQTVTVEGDEIHIDNGHLTVDDVDGLLVAVFAAGRWANAKKEKESA